MTKKKWDNDGPRLSSQGYGWDWRFLQTILRMSHEAGKNRADVDAWREFIDAHPAIRADLIRRINLTNVPLEKLVEYLLDLIERHASETRRRKKALENTQ